MNFRFVVVAALLPFTLALGQDVVRYRNGDSATVKVTEIGESQIQYKRLDNLEGPAYSIKKNEVESITYANGSTDRFVMVAENKESVHPLDSMMTSICSKPEVKNGKKFTINYGEKVFKEHSISITGICKSGLFGSKLVKHGQFDFYDGNKLVMKTKFSKDSEEKTDCVFNADKRRISQKACFDAYFNKR